MFPHRKLLPITSILVILTILFSSFPGASAQAQGKDGLKREVNPQTGRISFLGPENGISLSAAQALGAASPARPADPGLALAKRFGSEFGLKNPERELSAMKTHRGENGRIMARYQQTYQGIPVMGGELIVNTNDSGDLYSMNGEVSPGLSLSIQPTVDSEQAKQIALQAVAKWYQKTSEDFQVSEPELWIFDESLLRPSTRPVELVWRMEVKPREIGMPVRELVLVDAQSGDISLHFNQIDTAWTGSGKRVGSQSDQPTKVVNTISKALTSQIGPLAPTTWYVTTGGNDSNSCMSAGSPCATINAAIGKAAASGDTVKVAVGIYTGTDVEVVLLDKNISLSGGWNTAFTTQSGLSTIDGQNVRRGIRVYNASANITVSVDHFLILNGHYSYYGDGGGITNTFRGNLTVVNSSIQNNSSGHYGGGIYSTGNLTVINTTISNNSAYVGGGIYSDILMTLNNSTVSNNSASMVGGISGGATISNSILAGNTDDDGIPNCEHVYSQGNNIIGNTIRCIVTTPTTSDQLNVNPQLGPFLPTLGYYPLLSSSPAIDAGNAATCTATDQRGVVRPVGARCDIGAFEYRGGGTTPAYISILQGTPQTIAPGTMASTPFKVVVLDSQGDSVSGKGVTFTAPASGASGTFANTNTNVATVVTDTNGIATAPAFTANNILGAYIISAIVSGVPASADFQLSNGKQQVKTYTTNNTSSLPGAFLCDQTQPNCTNGINPHADAAHRYAIGTYNLYAVHHSRDSIDNHGAMIISSVHYCTVNDCPYFNANWTGEQMVYGDGFGYPLADDVVAHELTHGVTQYESNLFYYYQSGAINESFSDLWGEYYDQTNGLGTDTASVKWQLGEDILDRGTLRNMSDPTIYGDPDKLSSPNYFEGEEDNGGVHYNSGINNKAVFLMVDGGTFNGKTVTALGWDKTAAIYYEVNTNLLSSGADYWDLYYALQQACTNLIGQKGITAGDCAEVKDALDAVEMNGQPAPNFNTDAPYCDTGNPVSTILSDDLEAGTGNWTFTNGASPRWQVDSPDYGPFAQSGLHSLYADDYPDVVTDATARLKPFFVQNNTYLRFAQAYDFETGYNTGDPTFHNFDGGVLEYSLNNGASWVDAGSLIDVNGYKGTLFTGAGNPLSGRSAFVGTSHGYISTRLNLSALIGGTVSFRWRMGLDEAGYYGGWWVDNVQVYTCPAILSKDTTGVFRPSNGLLYLKNSNTTGFADVAINYGLGGDYPVVGDWDGNGTVTIGIYRNAKFYLRNSNSLGFADWVIAFGQAGDQPVAGDWDGDGIDTIGVYRQGQFFLRNSNTEGPAEKSFALGNAGDVGIAGDWNGDGLDTTGVFRPSNGYIYLKNTNETGFADWALNYGIPGDKPVTGDWNGDGVDTIGVYRGNNFYLRNSNTNGFAEITFALGNPGDMPIAGNWDALP